ncbi:MAG: type II secretion system F family protein [Actinomycetia bacterium]|nr:type II secretion system F family protein [Actinomycetes bacterium]
MGAVLGLLLGLGVVLVWWALTDDQLSEPPTQGTRDRVSDALVQAGLEGVTPLRVGLSCVGVGVVGFVVAAGVSRSVVIGAAFGVLAAYLPIALVQRHRRQRAAALQGAWPDVVDDLASAVRAGLSLPEALAQLGTRGPEQLRPAFARFAADYRATGRFGPSLDRLKDSLADPTGDRVVEALRVAREVGGNDLGRLLRTLSGFLREDARTRGELESRQAWAVNAARLAVAAPWVVLALLSLRPEAVTAYDSTAGLVVLGTGGAVSVVAYRLMVRIGRLPREERVLR